MRLPARLAATLGVVSILVLAFAGVAGAQGPHQHGSPSTALSGQEVAVSVVHGATQGTAVFLAGLVAFTALVWLPANRWAVNAGQEKVVYLLGRWMWVLAGLLIIAGLVELPLYAVRASGEALSLGLLREALFDTRVGQLWVTRLVFGILVAGAATYAIRMWRSVYWWGAAIIASALLLVTLTQQSHAVAEESSLPFVADWIHVMAASVWMGGLLGFSILLIGPLRAMPSEARTKVLGDTVRRFSKVASVAVMTLIVTGSYAILLHVPSLSALVDTPYGRALSIKLTLLAFLLALGAWNMRLRGQGPFNNLVRVELALAICIFVATGFLTSLPPAENVQHFAPNPIEDIRQPPMPPSPAPNIPTPPAK